MIVAALVSSQSSGQNFLGHHDAAGTNRQWIGSMNGLKPWHQGSMYSFVCIGTAAANHSPYQFAWCFPTAHDASLSVARLLHGVSFVLEMPDRARVASECELQRTWNGSGG